MNILLVITNINGFHEIPYSFGLSSIASYIKNKKYNTKILSIREENEYDEFCEEVKSFNPRVIGFSSVSSQFHHVKKIAELIKNINENIFIVCGGIHPTIFSDALLESEAIDGFFVGESETGFGNLLDKIKGNEDFRDINNFAYKEDGKIIVNQLDPLIQHLDVLPYPMKDSLFEEFINTNGFAPFLFSRGCPFSCSYCSNHAIAKIYGMSRNKPRYRSVESCIEEIKVAREEYRFQTVYIMDDTFGLEKKWRKEFCEKYRKEINVKFICLLRVNVVDEEFVKLLKKAGCYRIQFGVESGNEYVRNTVMNRNMSDKQIIEAFGLCRKYGIQTNALNIIGVPGETDDMIWDTIRLNRKIKPTDSAVNIFYPYKGTVLGDYCFSNDLVDEKLYNNFSNERRDSVLKYSREYKDKLQHYHKNWNVLVYPYNIKKRIYTMLKEHKIIYNQLRKIKRRLQSFLPS